MERERAVRTPMKKAQASGLRLLLANRSRSLPLRRASITALRTVAIGRRTVAVAMWADAFGPAILAAHASFRAARARRTHFVHRDFAVAVFIEFAQGLRGVLDFVLVDHAIVSRIEGGHEWRNHRARPCSAGTAGAISVRPIHVRRFTRTHVPGGGTLAVLRARLF